MELGEIANNIQVYGLGLALAIALELVTQAQLLIFWIASSPLPLALLSNFMRQKANQMHTLSWTHAFFSGTAKLCGDIAKWILVISSIAIIAMLGGVLQI